MKALITGASSGIGREISIELARRGIDVVLSARRGDRLLKLKSEIESSFNVSATVLEVDLSDEKQCFGLENVLLDTDILVNNAGFGIFGKFEDTPLEDDLKLIDVNIRAVHILTKLFVKKRNDGYILNVASIAGFMAGPLLSSYYASKAYVLRLSQAVCEELFKDKKNISVSVLCPGPVDTEFDGVAGVKSGLKSQTPYFVAKYAVDKMFKKKRVIVPGFKIKLLIFLNRIVPGSVMIKCTHKMQKKKMKG